jgi:hypothetical protein
MVDRCRVEGVIPYSRFPFPVSRFTIHDSRFTFPVLRFTTSRKAAAEILNGLTQAFLDLNNRLPAQLSHGERNVGLTLLRVVFRQRQAVHRKLAERGDQ